MATKKKIEKRRRAVVVGGVRTPFLRAFTDFIRLPTWELGAAAVSGLLDKVPVKHADIDGICWGAVVVGGNTVNVGREIVLELKLPPTIEASMVSRACTSSLLSTTLAAAAIERGEADILIAGGSDSTSNAQVTMPQSLVHKAAPVVMSSKSGPMDYLNLIASINPKKDLMPRQPAIRERTTGELMGEAAEKMAKRWGITREAQDAFTLQTHMRAARAVESGRLADEIVPVKLKGGKTVYVDNIIRTDATLERLAKLRPAFAKDGTLTAANSSALTDGAAAVLLMSEEKAAEYGLKPLAAFRSWSYDAVDPSDQLLIGPAISIPKALARAGMSLDDADLVDIHEAFAAQVLCVLKALESPEFGRQRLGLKGAAGHVTPDGINVHGGSLAFGHPFAATGARMITTMANELARTDAKTAVIGICAQGGQSGAAVMEEA